MKRDGIFFANCGSGTSFKFALYIAETLGKDVTDQVNAPLLLTIKITHRQLVNYLALVLEMN